MSRRGVAFRWRIRNLLGGARYLAQGRCKRERAAADLRTDAVGLIFSAAADAELHERCGDRRKNDKHEAADRPNTLVVAVSTAEIKAEIGEHGNRAGKRRRNGHGQRVAMLDVAKFVREHAGELVA